MIGRSVPHKLPVDNLALSQIAQAPNMAPKRGPGLGRGLAGSVGDFLLQYAGARPVFGPTMQRRQEIEFMNERDARNRSLDWRDFVQRETFKRENPPPVNNDTVADYQFIRETLGDEAARSFLKNKTLPPMVGVDIQNPDGSVTRQFYPRGGVPGTSAPQGFDALPPGFVVDEGGASPGGSRPFP